MLCQHQTIVHETIAWFMAQPIVGKHICSGPSLASLAYAPYDSGCFMSLLYDTYLYVRAPCRNIYDVLYVFPQTAQASRGAGVR